MMKMWFPTTIILSLMICLININNNMIVQVNGILYLPGVSPSYFPKGANVKMFVNRLTSTKTQVPYDYYSLPFCHPKHIKGTSENLGEILAGDKIEANGLYHLSMKVPTACEIVCRVELNKRRASKFIEAIDMDYRVHWIVDNLPVGTLVMSKNTAGTETFYIRGFPVGGIAYNNRHFIYNHVRIIISYNDDDKPERGSRIVGFQAEPFSIRHSYEELEFDPEMPLQTCNAMVPATNDPLNYMYLDGADEIIFTYDVDWKEEPNVAWSHRWDMYLKGNPDDNIHWFSITNSTLIAVFLTVMVGMILVRSLNRDIQRYNEGITSNEAKEEFGWKLVHADVFRPPTTYPQLFTVLIGSGVQIFVMTFITLFFALLGFLSPANRGSLVTAFVLLYVFLGSFSGYVSSRLYKMFRGTDFKRQTAFTALLYPSIMFTVFLVLDLGEYALGSTLAIPVGYFFLLLLLWFGVSVPLVFLGSYFGYKKDIIENPCRTNQIPREVPEQKWYMSDMVTIALCGILPFGAVSVELFFILSALWLHQIYYIFGFLFIVMLILVATISEITIVMSYFQLCNEDYNWWWRSFLSGGSCAIYVFLYSIWYFTNLDMEGSMGVTMYFGYMTMICITFFLLCGCIGFFSCFAFIRTIYSAVKVD